MIKTVIFDLGRVIVPFDFARGYAGMAPHCPYEPAEIPKRIGSTDLVQRFESGQVGPEDFVQELSAILDLSVNYEQFCEIWSSIFLPYTLVPDSLVEGIARHQRLLLLSNTNAIHFGMIQKNYPILRHFHHCVLSHEVGAMKPSPRIYQEAVLRAGCEPGECFFTDDIPDYVAGARAHGIDAVQFESAEQIQRELSARNVRWD